MRRTWIITFALVLLAATAAQAFGFGDVKAWLSSTAVALLLTAILAIGVVGAFVARYTAIVGAFGWLLVELDNAASDKKITKEELATLKAKWTAVRDAVKAAKNG